MTEITLLKDAGKIRGFYGKGHSGYSEKGSDIICSAISVLTQQVVVGIVDYLEIDIKVKTKDGYLYIDLREVSLDDYEKELDTLFETMYMMLIQIEEQYPENLKLVVEEGKNV